MPTNQTPRRASHMARHARSKTWQTQPSPAKKATPFARAKVIGENEGMKPAGGGRVSSRTAAATRQAAGNAGTRQAAVRGQAAASRPRSKRTFALVAGAAALLLIAGFLIVRFVIVPSGDKPQVEPGKEVTVTIPEGAGGYEIAALLEKEGVISDQAEFVKQVTKQGLESTLKPGTYTLHTGADLQSVIKLLANGPNSGVGVVTVAEGRTLAGIAADIEASVGIPADQFLAQAKASNYVADYPFLADAANSGYDSLEGFLFPKTYDFSTSDITADAVIRKMLDQYKKEIVELDFEKARSSIAETYGVTLSDYDLLKLASIVEREAITDEQRPTVAGIFMNRLSGKLIQGRYLQSDATMGYVTGGEVSAADLKTDSPYNTYLNQGLTPTPICSPGVASLAAVLAPEKTDYLYFWITDSETVYSNTYEEHQAAIAASKG